MKTVWKNSDGDGHRRNQSQFRQGLHEGWHVLDDDDDVSEVRSQSSPEAYDTMLPQTSTNSGRYDGFDSAEGEGSNAIGSEYRRQKPFGMDDNDVHNSSGSDFSYELDISKGGSVNINRRRRLGDGTYDKHEPLENDQQLSTGTLQKLRQKFRKAYQNGQRLPGSDSEYSYHSVNDSNGMKQKRRKKRLDNGSHGNSESYNSSQDEEGKQRRKTRRTRDRVKYQSGKRVPGSESEYSYRSAVSEGGTRRVRRRRRRTGKGGHTASSSPFHSSQDEEGQARRRHRRHNKLLVNTNTITDSQSRNLTRTSLNGHFDNDVSTSERTMKSQKRLESTHTDYRLHSINKHGPKSTEENDSDSSCSSLLSEGLLMGKLMKQSNLSGKSYGHTGLALSHSSSSCNNNYSGQKDQKKDKQSNQHTFATGKSIAVNAFAGDREGSDGKAYFNCLIMFRNYCLA